MAKKGPMSSVEKFYIDGHINDSPESLAKELDRTVNFVEKYIKSIINSRPTITETKSTEKSSINKDQFARRKGTVVMTEAASEISDDVRKMVKSGINLQDQDSFITKIR
jgi:hypothetical protein